MFQYLPEEIQLEIISHINLFWRDVVKGWSSEYRNARSLVLLLMKEMRSTLFSQFVFPIIKHISDMYSFNHFCLKKLMTIFLKSKNKGKMLGDLITHSDLSVENISCGPNVNFTKLLTMRRHQCLLNVPVRILAITLELGGNDMFDLLFKYYRSNVTLIFNMLVRNKFQDAIDKFLEYLVRVVYTKNCSFTKVLKYVETSPLFNASHKLRILIFSKQDTRLYRACCAYFEDKTDLIKSVNYINSILDMFKVMNSYDRRVVGVCKRLLAIRDSTCFSDFVVKCLLSNCYGTKQSCYGVKDRALDFSCCVQKRTISLDIESDCECTCDRMITLESEYCDYYSDEDEWEYGYDDCESNGYDICDIHNYMDDFNEEVGKFKGIEYTFLTKEEKADERIANKIYPVADENGNVETTTVEDVSDSESDDDFDDYYGYDDYDDRYDYDDDDRFNNYDDYNSQDDEHYYQYNYGD